MAWAKPSLPGGALARGAWYGTGRWLLTPYSGTDFWLTSDFVSYTTVPFSAIGGETPWAAANDGAQWYVITLNRIYRSTDGLTGSTWVGVNPPFPGKTVGQRGGKAIACGNGRIVALSSTADYAVSSDGGTTWGTKGTLINPTNSDFDQHAHWTGSQFIVTAGAFTFALGSADGETWSEPNPSGALERIHDVAHCPAGLFAVPNYNSFDVYTSTDGGATWAPTVNSEMYHRVASVGGVVYHYRETWPGASAVLEVYSSSDLATWSPVDMTDVTAEWLDWLSAGDLLVGGLFWNGNATGGVFTTDLVAGGGGGGGAPIVLPARLEVGANAAITLPARLSVGETGASITLPARLAVIDAAATGGLNGAGGWPAAPDGKWRPVVVLDGSDISAQLIGEVSVSHADNEARTAEFTFRPASAMQPLSLIGRRVQIAFAQRDAAGAVINAQTIFTGVIETPTIDMQTRQISCACHDQMQEVMSNTPRSWIDSNLVGRWRQEVSGEPQDSWDYAEARRASVPSSLALNALQQPVVLPWAGAGLTSVTVRPEDILDSSLAIDLPSRDELRTRIVCRMQYRYERLRGRGAVASYSQSLRFFIGDFRPLPGRPIYGVQWLTASMVKGAAEGMSGWNLNSLTIDQPAPGSYLIGDTPVDGVYIIAPSVAPDLAMGFNAKFVTRWQQTATEDYTVTVALPDVESAIGGPVSEEIGATLEAKFDVDDWGSDPAVSPALSIPTAGDVALPWQPAGAAASDRDEVLRTLLDQAWVRLWASSRTGRVRFDMPLRPDLWLDWYVTVETAAISAAGKVVEVTHTMNAQTGAAITSVGLSVGLPGATPANMPTWSLPAVTMPDESRPGTAYSIHVGTYVGGETTSPPFDEQTMIGFVTNLDLSNQTPSFNWYPHQLSIKAPDIDAVDRDPLTIPVEAVINTTIPTDLLEIL